MYVTTNVKALRPGDEIWPYAQSVSIQNPKNLSQVGDAEILSGSQGDREFRVTLKIANINSNAGFDGLYVDWAEGEPSYFQVLPLSVKINSTESRVGK